MIKKYKDIYESKNMIKIFMNCDFCNECNENGEVVDNEQCYTCGGSGNVDYRGETTMCYECGGIGEIEEGMKDCEICEGLTKVEYEIHYTKNEGIVKLLIFGQDKFIDWYDYPTIIRHINKYKNKVEAEEVVNTLIKDIIDKKIIINGIESFSFPNMEKYFNEYSKKIMNSIDKVNKFNL